MYECMYGCMHVCMSVCMCVIGFMFFLGECVCHVCVMCVSTSTKKISI